MSFLDFGLQLVERNLLPDALVRHGIRRLLRQRLSPLSQDTSGPEQVLRKFRAACLAQPIAVVPELANEQHYEVPADLFLHALGPRLKYSSCYFDETTGTLGEAEERALAITAEHAELADGQAILELGCGWGSLTLWMAEHYPGSRITAVSNSASQREFIMARARERGLSNIVVHTADINHFAPSGRFDRVVSVEMFEHMRNHAELLRRIATWLNKDGKLFVHIFCHRSTPYLFETEGSDNWMGRYFFSGGMMPSWDLLPSYDADLRLEDRWQWNGRHYARTCREWLKNCDRNRAAVLPILTRTYGEKNTTLWLSRWRVFFMACEELFAYRDGEEWFVAHYRFGK